MQTTANGPKGSTDWKRVNWRKANRQVRNLRYRIFRASQAGDWKTVSRLQKLMLRSYSNRLLSVRRVTQVNHGKRTAGVDKVLVKTSKARGELVDDLGSYRPWQALPAKRIFIPKANGKTRPLGIPVMRDRALQATVKNSLEPSWEAQFELSNYGFRPGRGCHDAIVKIYGLARPNKRKKWVVDADITGAFDNIDHNYLLNAIGAVPGRALIRQWLKAGYVDQNVFHPTEAGTPQGGVISPLLANIALHGLEQALGVRYRISSGHTELRSKRAVVRYADDVVVFCESREDAEAVQEELVGWLAQRGLELSTDKTRIVHLTEGFDFLGFNIRHYAAPQTSKSGYKLLIKPSKVSVLKLRARLREEWLSLKGQNVGRVTQRLNPIIRGWANYFRIGVASETFGALDNWMFQRELRYVRHTHPTKPWYWRKAQYWGRLNLQREDNWVFGNTHTGVHLQKFRWFDTKRHALVAGTASPDDSTLRDYWAKRRERQAVYLRASDQIIAKRQNYVCAVCNESLFNGEELHRHHVIPRNEGGNNCYANLVLRHLYCHQQLHGTGGSQMSMETFSDLLEPDALKDARPVLRGG